MSKSILTIIALSLAFLGSNVWWAYQSLDAGITKTYADASFDSTQKALAQSLAAISAASNKDATKETIITTVNKVGNNTPPFEKDGFVWVGEIGLKFDAQGKLIAATASGDTP